MNLCSSIPYLHYIFAYSHYYFSEILWQFGQFCWVKLVILEDLFYKYFPMYMISEYEGIIQVNHAIVIEVFVNLS